MKKMIIMEVSERADEWTAYRVRTGKAINAIREYVARTPDSIWRFADDRKYRNTQWVKGVTYFDVPCEIVG